MIYLGVKSRGAGKITIAIAKELKADLCLVAMAEGYSISGLVRRAIECLTAGYYIGGSCNGCLDGKKIKTVRLARDGKVCANGIISETSPFWKKRVVDYGEFMELEKGRPMQGRKYFCRCGFLKEELLSNRNYIQIYANMDKCVQ